MENLYTLGKPSRLSIKGLGVFQSLLFHSVPKGSFLVSLALLLSFGTVNSAVVVDSLYSASLSTYAADLAAAKQPPGQVSPEENRFFSAVVKGSAFPNAIPRLSLWAMVLAHGNKRQPLPLNSDLGISLAPEMTVRKKLVALNGALTTSDLLDLDAISGGGTEPMIGYPPLLLAQADIPAPNGQLLTLDEPSTPGQPVAASDAPTLNQLPAQGSPAVSAPADGGGVVTAPPNGGDSGTAITEQTAPAVGATPTPSVTPANPGLSSLAPANSQANQAQGIDPQIQLPPPPKVQSAVSVPASQFGQPQQPIAKQEVIPTPAPSPEAPVLMSDAPTVYKVRRGDTLGAIARMPGVPEASPFQKLVGLFNANKSAFATGNMHHLEIGRTLVISTLGNYPDEASARRIVLSQYREYLASRPKVRPMGMKKDTKKGGVSVSVGKEGSNQMPGEIVAETKLPPVPEYVPPTVVTDTPPTQPSSSSSKPLIIALLALLFAAAGGYIFFRIRSRNKISLD